MKYYVTKFTFSGKEYELVLVTQSTMNDLKNRNIVQSTGNDNVCFLCIKENTFDFEFYGLGCEYFKDTVPSKMKWYIKDIG